MPSELPRIAVRVTKNQYRLISKLAQLQGRSRGAVVLDLIEAVEPVLERTAVILERAKGMPEGLKAGLRAVAEAAEERALPAVQEQLGILDLFVHATAAGTRPDGAAGAGGPPDPRTSNHGGQKPRAGATGKGRKA